MTQFDPNMVAQMLMQPVGKESLDNSIADENYFEAIEIPSGMVAPLNMDNSGGFFQAPDDPLGTAGKVAYGSAVAGASFVPGAGFVDAAGGAVDVTGQPLLSFGENIKQGNYLDAGFQALGVAGDVATFAAPVTLGTSALLGTLLKAPGAIRKTTNVADVASDVGSITRSSTLNEKGFDTDLVLYHGSSKPLKSVNDQRGLYLSPNSDVASYYTNPSYSAAAKSAGDFEEPAPNITPVHIKTEQIFDTRKPEHRKIFEEKFLNSYGNNTGIGEKGLPDWTDGEDFKEFFENENLPFKGVILDEGGFLDEGGEVVDRGVSYAIFDKDSVTPVLSDFDKLPLDKASRLARARELGFDVDNPIYHGTNTDKLTEFDESKIGLRDEGFFGRGFYFADNAGEAGYYGKNVGEYFVRGDLLDLTDTSGEPSYLGSPLIFINWAEKLDKIDMLDDTHKQALKGAKKVVKYFDENVKILPAQNADGTTGFTAKIIDPTNDGFDGDPREIFMRSRYDDGFPKTQEEAKERLFYQFADDVRTSFNKDTDFFEGFDNDFLFSLSDYIREGGDVSGLNASKLTKKAKEAGFDGIRAGDETVIFDAKNIRSTDAAFDPEKTDSPQLLSSLMQDSMTAVA